MRNRLVYYVCTEDFAVGHVRYTVSTGFSGSRLKDLIGKCSLELVSYTGRSSVR